MKWLPLILLVPLLAALDQSARVAGVKLTTNAGCGKAT